MGCSNFISISYCLQDTSQTGHKKVVVVVKFLSLDVVSVCCKGSTDLCRYVCGNDRVVREFLHGIFVLSYDTMWLLWTTNNTPRTPPNCPKPSVCNMKALTIPATTITPQPLYGPFSGTNQVSQYQKRTSGLYGAKED